MEVQEGMACCNYLELVGFNGKENINDEDPNDAQVYNILGGIRAVANAAGVWNNGDRLNVGSLFMTVAWDRPEGNLQGLQPWERYNPAKPRVESILKARIRKFCKFIRDHNLGTTHCIPDTINPNHESGITTRIWHLNADGLRAFVATQGWDDEDNGYDEDGPCW